MDRWHIRGRGAFTQHSEAARCAWGARVCVWMVVVVVTCVWRVKWQ